MAILDRTAVICKIKINAITKKNIYKKQFKKQISVKLSNFNCQIVHYLIHIYRDDIIAKRRHATYEIHRGQSKPEWPSQNMAEPKEQTKKHIVWAKRRQVGGGRDNLRLPNDDDNSKNNRIKKA